MYDGSSTNSPTSMAKPSGPSVPFLRTFSWCPLYYFAPARQTSWVSVAGNLWHVQMRTYQWFAEILIAIVSSWWLSCWSQTQWVRVTLSFHLMNQNRTLIMNQHSSTFLIRFSENYFLYLTCYSAKTNQDDSPLITQYLPLLNDRIKLPLRSRCSVV